VSALTSLLYFSLKYYFSLSFFTLFCKASLIGCCSTGGTSLCRPPVLAGGEESEWCLPVFLASCSAVVQWCSSAFLVFSDGKEESCEGRKKTQKTATAIVEKRREKKKKEKGGDRK
jgi:hypothetical protein